MNGWVYLVAAGGFEVAFTTAMNFTGKGRWAAEAAFLAAVILSFACLQQATRTIPIGIAYAVWTGIGALGTLAVSTLIFKAPIAAPQIGFALLMIIALIGLKLTAPQA